MEARRGAWWVGLLAILGSMGQEVIREVDEFADSEAIDGTSRLQALQDAILIVQEHPLHGVAAADIAVAEAKVFDARLALSVRNYTRANDHMDVGFEFTCLALQKMAAGSPCDPEPPLAPISIGRLELPWPKPDTVQEWRRAMAHGPTQIAAAAIVLGGVIAAMAVWREGRA